MNKYLLLRDNKQSGPYSVDELASHGLKAYDLVWLEGKSAAWRYPSEIAELKPFAPAVEEQPFDRFYKKSETKTKEPVIRDNTAVKENHSFGRVEIKKTETASPEFVEVKINSSKKIHVSLPGKKSPDPVIPKSSKEEVPQVENIKPVAQPVLVADEPITYSVNKTNNNFESQGNFEEPYRKSKQKTSVSDKTSANQAPVSKLLFRSVAAACLLLGGALIGLIINYNNQQKKFQQLNQLVQEIRHQDNPVSSVPAKNDAIQLKTNVEEVTPLIEEPTYKEDIQLPPVKKDRRDTKSVKQASDTPSVPLVNESDALSAALKNEETIEKPDKASTELARKNLWQLVSVENNNYKTGVFGGISNLSLKLSNKSLYQLEQVEVEVRFLTPEKKIVNKQTVVFENVSPGEQLSLDIPKSGRGVKIDYSIKKINTKEFGIAHAGM